VHVTDRHAGVQRLRSALDWFETTLGHAQG
jgi:hypothetical protein